MKDFAEVKGTGLKASIFLLAEEVEDGGCSKWNTYPRGEFIGMDALLLVGTSLPTQLRP
jgi:hypothetical protein